MPQSRSHWTHDSSPDASAITDGKGPCDEAIACGHVMPASFRLSRRAPQKSDALSDALLDLM